MVKRVGTRDGSALRLVSGSVQSSGSSRAEMKEKERRHMIWMLPPNRGRAREEKRAQKGSSIRECLREFIYMKARTEGPERRATSLAS